MQDVLQLAIIALVPPILIIAFLSFVLHYFVALSAPPTRRAAWTAGIPYLIACGLLIFAGPGEYAIYVPLAALPGGLIAFLYWRSEFRRAWIENEEDLPDGAVLANDDWGIGILRFLAFVCLAIGVAVIRFLMRGGL